MNPTSSIDEAPTTADESRPTTPKSRLRGLGLERFSGIYVWGGLVVLFGLWVPDTFLTVENARIVAADQAITAMIAFAVVVALAAGVFDLSVAATMGVAVTIVIAMQSQGHHPLVAVFTAVLVGVAIGLVNGFVVVHLHVESLIATLGMSSILAAVAHWVTDGKQIVTGISPSFLRWGRESIFGLPAPIYYMVATALVIWYVLEHTPAGRKVYAVGGNPVAARLAGVRVDRVTWGALVATSTVATMAGVVLAARLGSATPEVGPAYLLPAFSAAFLGATQIKRGRMNIPGTLIAIFLLATGVKGLQLVGAPSYVNYVFNGLALIVAVALAVRTRNRR